MKMDQDKPFKCNFEGCQLQTTEARYLRRHIVTHQHNRTRDFPCTLCPKAFFCKGTLMNHLRTHIQEKIFKCSSCDFSSPHRASLFTHKKRVHDEQYQRQREHKDWKYKCDLCDYRAPHLYRVTNHARIHGDAKPFACSVEGCNYKAKSQTSIHAHQRSHRELPGKIYSCDKCSFQTRHQTALKGHAVRHVEEGPITCGCDGDNKCHDCLNKTFYKRLKCPVSGCNFTTLRKDSLPRHAHTHSDDKTFACEFCEHKAKTKKDLNNHKKRKHLDRGEKTLQCPLCGKMFHSPAGLRAHVRSHTGEKYLRCPQVDCSYQTNNSACLRHHEARHSATALPIPDYRNEATLYGKLVPVEGRPEYKCNLCEYQAKYPCRMVEHARAHGSVKPFACTVGGCDYRTRWKECLRLHLRSHHELPDKVYHCDQCDFQTRLPPSLKRHVKVRHSTLEPMQCKVPATYSPIPVEEGHSEDVKIATFEHY